MFMRAKRFYTLPVLLILVFLFFVLIHDIIGGTLLESSPYNSYTLQALAWRSGRLDLGRDYPWLELAICNGRYYVSFPPVPTLIMLPLTYIFGESTPDNIVVLVFALLMITAVYFCIRKNEGSEITASFWAIFLVLGSNLLWMCTDGSVWFLAQSLNMVLCLFAILSALNGKRILSFILVALAVGCRPFSALLFIPLFLYFMEEDIKNLPELSRTKRILPLWKILIGPVLIAGAYAFFNYLRFRNPFEFGHSFLPEFNRGTAQFSFANIWPNLKCILRPVTLDQNMRPEFPIYDGFLFFLANPFFIIAFTRFRKLRPYQIGCIACMGLNLLLLLMHRTFGGWQFGARYTVDLLSYAFLLCLPSFREKPKNWEVLLGAFAVMFNLYGTICMNLFYN